VNFEKVFKTIDALMAVRNISKEKGTTSPNDTSVTGTAQSRLGGQIESGLTTVLVAALKEAFDRDHARLELERAQVEEQRRRAEEAIQLELQRQAVDRELGRLRLLTGAAMVGWIVSAMLLVMRSGELSAAAMILQIAGCLLLLVSLGGAFTAQAQISDQMGKTNASPNVRLSGASLWLLLAGLGLTAASLLT
jgi:hypothetical protein